jgi:hypothetical protein
MAAAYQYQYHRKHGQRKQWLGNGGIVWRHQHGVVSAKMKNVAWHGENIMASVSASA